MQLNQAEAPHILIVDDEPQVAGALADVLEDHYSVFVETSPEAALARLAADKRIAVIVSDQRMPGMTGDKLFMHAQQISIATRVLITAYADIGAVIDAVNAGKIFAYVTKPWQLDDIVLTVNRAAEHCKLNRKILEAQSLLHQLMESSVDAIAIKDRHHRYIKLNRAEAFILGADDIAEVEGRTAAEFLTPERIEPRLADEIELIGKGLTLRDRVEHVTAADGRNTWYSSNLAPIRDLSGDVIGIVGITRDVSETKRLDEMKDQFIATVRHELRTPLTAIHASLGLLRGGVLARDAGNRGSQAARLVEIGHDNCAKLLTLIADLLDTVNLENGEMEFAQTPVALADVVADAIAINAARAEQKRVRLIADVNSSLLRVEIDRARLAKALAKLVANAIDVTPEGGEVSAAARMEDDTVRIAVTDQGPGVSPQLQPLLFKRFSQGDSSNSREKGGVGLGLYIAKSIVDAHEGEIGFVNRPSGGAEFFIALPQPHSDTVALAENSATRHAS